METRRRELFTTVHTEGALLPSDVLQRVLAGDRDLSGLRPEDYGLSGERLNEATANAWQRARGAWQVFRRALATIPEGRSAATVTREKWLAPLFEKVLEYGPIRQEKGAVELGGKSYPLTHVWQGRVPLHLLGADVDLDRRTPGVVGAAHTSPHGLVQEFLNRSKEHDWAFLSNGLTLRILRDNVSLTRQAYVEFDLRAMMDGEVYSDFALLWLVCHSSRVAAERPQDCWLERWRQAAQEQGARVRERLRVGVQEAIEALGRGFIAHPENPALREKLRAGTLATDDYYRQLLRTVYRVIFLFVAEDRTVDGAPLLLDPSAPPEARARYLQHYSTGRLRRLADRRRGDRHPDLWRQLSLVMGFLGHDEGCPALALPALGSFLWRAGAATPDLDGCELDNESLLNAVRALAFTVDAGVNRPVDYRNLGSEELGSVYEALLELHPTLDLDAGWFRLGVGAGSDRKTSGSYYTPPSLVQSLLDTALEPVVRERLAAARNAGDAQDIILGLKVCDPACGSGHFLVAAAHRLARHLAAWRSGDPEGEPPPGETQRALRQVVAHCIHGVDINPMAVELCKVSLWMEAMAPGRPLAFLDSKIRCGNSLLGATPKLLADGVPDEAFRPIEGDDPEVAARWRRENQRDMQAQRDLGQVSQSGQDLRAAHKAVQARALGLERLPDEVIAGVHEKERAHAEARASQDFHLVRTAADAFGAAFVWPLTDGEHADAWTAAFTWRKEDGAPPPPTQYRLRCYQDGLPALPAATRAEIDRLAEEYQFFHWHVEFPNVFASPVDGEEAENPVTGWSGGFDVVLGNPPWERLKIQEKEWFASRDPDIVKAPNAAARKKRIEALREGDPRLYAEFQAALRRSDGESHLIRSSGRFPLTATGDINTYAIFAELVRHLVARAGRVGVIIPTGIATDFTTRDFFAALVSEQAISSLYGFENEEHVFAAVHNATKFCLLTLSGAARRCPSTDFAFLVRQASQLEDEERHWTLSSAEFRRLNPNTRTCPVFRWRRDAEITKGIYGRVSVLVDEGQPDERGNPWGVSFLRMLDMANDSGLFRTADQLEPEGFRFDGSSYRRAAETYLPLYEAKMVHHFDHRFGTYDGQTEGQANKGFLPQFQDADHADPTKLPLARYWVDRREVLTRIALVPRKLAKAALDGDSTLAAHVVEAWRAACGSDQHLALAIQLPPAAERLIPEMRKEGIPFTPEDEVLIRRAPTPLAAAWALIEARSPRWLMGWRDISRSVDER